MQNMGVHTLVKMLKEMHDIYFPDALKSLDLTITPKTMRTSGITFKKRKLNLTSEQVALSSHHKDMRALDGYNIPDAKSNALCSLAMQTLGTSAPVSTSPSLPRILPSPGPILQLPPPPTELNF